MTLLFIDPKAFLDPLSVRFQLNKHLIKTLIDHAKVLDHLRLHARYDAVVIDIQNHPNDGFELIRAIREDGRRDIPIIGATEEAGGMELIRLAAAAGANGLVSMQTLNQRVREPQEVCAEVLEIIDDCQVLKLTADS